MHHYPPLLSERRQSKISRILLQGRRQFNCSFDLVKHTGSCTVVDTMVKIENLFKTSFSGLVLPVDTIIALVKPGLHRGAVTLGTGLLDQRGGVHQILLFLLLLLQEKKVLSVLQCLNV